MGYRSLAVGLGARVQLVRLAGLVSGGSAAALTSPRLTVSHARLVAGLDMCARVTSRKWEVS